METETLNSLIESAPDVIHSLVIGAIFGIAILVFRKPIVELLGRVQSHESTFLGKTRLSTARKIVENSENPSLSLDFSGGPENRARREMASAYWFGSKLFATSMAIALDLPNEDIQGAVKKSLQYFREAGLKDEEIENRLERLIQFLEKISDSELPATPKKHAQDEADAIRELASQFINRSAGPDFSGANERD